MFRLSTVAALVGAIAVLNSCDAFAPSMGTSLDVEWLVDRDLFRVNLSEVIGIPSLLSRDLKCSTWYYYYYHHGIM